MGVPKRKTSKSKIRTRRRALKGMTTAMTPCSQCGKLHIPHRVCPSCGYYRGRQVLTIEAE